LRYSAAILVDMLYYNHPLRAC